MLTLRKAHERGKTDFGWLKSAHTFSFGDYFSAEHTGFRKLRVINDDRVAPGKGFGTHPHRDMEIFSYVLAGQLEHKDSLGNGRGLKPGEVQLMSAGRGVTHSEFNPSPSEWAHFLQIWIEPRERGLAPSYTEWKPDSSQLEAAKVLVISSDGKNGSAIIHQDVEVYRLRLKAGVTATHALRSGRAAWLQVATGEMSFNDAELKAGDGAATERSGDLMFRSETQAEALLFDLG